MGNATGVVVAAVHVRAPDDVDPYVIEAELTRAICTNRKRPMTAELALAEEVRTPARGVLRRHGYVAVLSLGGTGLPDDLERRLAKLVRKALHRRFGQQVTARVRLDISAAEVGAYWCSVRGRPQRVA